MKQFTEFSKEDQRLICEAMRIQNKAALAAIKGSVIDTDDEFINVIQYMSYGAKEFLAETLKNTLPEEYKC